MRAPQELRDMLTQFWEANKHLQKLESSNAILNHFETPTTMVSLDDEELHVLGSGNKIIQAIWDATRPLVSEWTGQKLLGTSVYGIRVSRSVTELQVFDLLNRHPEHFLLCTWSFFSYPRCIRRARYFCHTSMIYRWYAVQSSMWRNPWKNRGLWRCTGEMEWQ